MSSPDQKKSVGFHAFGLRRARGGCIINACLLYTSRDDIDAIDITAPSNFHKEIAIAAAEHGKHVFCEKPLAFNASDAREIIAAVEKAGVKHQIGFNYRYVPALVLAKQMIESGKLGKIFHFRGSFLQDWIIDPDFPMVWRLDKNCLLYTSRPGRGGHNT